MMVPVLRARGGPASSNWAVAAGRNIRSSGGGAADEQRVDPQAQLVEQAVLEQGVRQLAEPVLHDVLAGLVLHAADLGNRVAADHRGVVPLGVAQRRFRPGTAGSPSGGRLGRTR